MSKTGVQMKPNADKKNEFYLELDILIDIHVFMKRIMLRNTSKDLNYHKVLEIVDQRLNDKRSLLVAALIAVFKILKANQYGLNLLSSSPLDIESYLGVNIDGKNLLKFAESCYNSLLKSYAKTIV
jgi:hypothetical protein